MYLLLLYEPLLGPWDPWVGNPWCGGTGAIRLLPTDLNGLQ